MCKDGWNWQINNPNGFIKDKFYFNDKFKILI